MGKLVSLRELQRTIMTQHKYNKSARAWRSKILSSIWRKQIDICGKKEHEHGRTMVEPQTFLKSKQIQKVLKVKEKIPAKIGADIEYLDLHQPKIYPLTGKQSQTLRRQVCSGNVIESSKNA